MVKQGFQPISNLNARVLILGSMPSERSLAEQQYYGHPRNAFWKIMATLTGVPFDAPYHQRTAALKDHRIALWDVIDQCERPGSLDSAIVPDSIRTNRLAHFIKAHKDLEIIALNGGKAWDLFRKVMKEQQGCLVGITVNQLPSTSPAYTLPLQDKIVRWQHALSSILMRD